MSLCKYDSENKCEVCGHVAQHGPSFRNCPALINADQIFEQSKNIYALVNRNGTGPGTELSKLLKRLGIEPTPTCQCRAKAAEMDAWGCDEASKPERIDEVVAVMRAEAEARGLPFLDMAGRLLVRRAIRNARKAAAGG